ncbi:MAG TPA: hypothetical protein VGM22_06275 [Methylomirabilota bacterium]
MLTPHALLELDDVAGVGSMPGRGSMVGDVHPRGNPHFSLDPGLAPIITQNIVDGLARVAHRGHRLQHHHAGQGATIVAA